MPDILWPLNVFVATVQRDLSLGLAIYALFAVALYGTIDLLRRMRQLLREAVAAHRGRVRRAEEMTRITRTHFDRILQEEREGFDPADAPAAISADERSADVPAGPTVLAS